MMHTIELLDANDNVITKVTGVSDAQAEFDNDYKPQYQAAKWRAYVPDVQEETELLRAEKIAAYKAEGLSRIAALIPALSDEKLLDFTIDILWPMLDTASAPAVVIQAKAIYSYARNRIAAARSATLVQLRAFDPVTDPGWP